MLEINLLTAGASRYYRQIYLILFNVDTGANDSRALLAIGYNDGEWIFDLLWFYNALRRERQRNRDGG